MFPSSRRRFLQVAGLASLTPALRAMEPFARVGAPRLRLSLAAYSFRDSFKPGKENEPNGGARRIDFPGFIDYCAEHGCEGAELTSYYFAKDVSDDDLRAVRRHAFVRGVSVSGTSIGNNFALPKGAELGAQIADAKRWIDRAAVLGAPHIRVFAGAPKGVTAEEGTRNCIEALEECCAYAGTRGIFLGLENHGGIVAQPEALLEIVRAVKSPWFGINLDTGNFHTADPYAALAQCAPYAVNVQVKTEIQPAGGKKGPVDFARLVKILRDANYQGWVALEYEAAEDPWTGVPKGLDALRADIGGSASGTAAAAGWTPQFDGKTLAGWKVTNFSGHGEVSVANGQIVLEPGDPLTGITLAQEPLLRTNYEIALEAMKLSGDDFFCGLTFPVGKESATLVTGGWGGTLVGISSIDGMDASENATAQFRKFEPNRWYKFRVRVTPEKLAAWIDDEQFVDEDIAGRKISMRAGEIELSAPLGIASFRTRSAVREVKIRKL